MLKFDPKKVIHTELLGVGQFGVVHPYRDPGNPADDRFAVKRMVQSCSDVTRAIQEIVLGFSCDHPNVLSVKGYHLQYDEKTSKWNIELKLPRMQKSLKDLLDQYNKTSNSFTLEEIVKFFYCIASGLAYLHGRKIIHRDIKLDNILIDRNGNPVIADIGIGLFAENESSITVSDWGGSANFKAPEVEKKLPIKKGDMYKTDIWSLGIVMAKLCLGKTHKAIDTVGSENGEDKEKLIKSKFNELKDKYDPELLALIAALVVSNPDKRTITAKQIVEILKEKYSHILEPNQLDLSEKKLASKTEPILLAPQDEKKLAQLSGQNIVNQPKFSEKKQLDKAEAVAQEKAVPNKLLEEKKNENVQEIKVLASQKSQDNKHEEKLTQAEEFKALKQKLNALKKEINTKWKGLYKLSVAETPLRLLLDPENPNEIKDGNLAEFMINLCESQHSEVLARLEGIRFSFAYCNKLSVRAMKNALKKIRSVCQNISFLELNLWGYKESINELCGQIGKIMPKLRNLGLFMEECANINGPLMELTNILLPKLTQLERLSLNFGSCANIDDEYSLKDLMAQIGQYAPNLNKLQLYFNDCLEITDDEITALSNKIGTNLKNLTSFGLMLSGCTKISENIIYELAKNVGSNLKLLQEIELGVVGIPISPDKEKAIKDSLSHIPNCQITTK